MRIRCKDCRKRISVDDAFAGGVCRCPYCKAINLVPGDAMTPTRTVRPDAPDARPQAPAPVATPAPPEKPPAEHEIPMARPVLVQGVVAIVGIAMLLVMLPAAIWLAVAISSEDPNSAPSPTGDGKGPSHGGAARNGQIVGPPPEVNPLSAGASASVAGEIPVESPVAYVLDGGASMGPMFDIGIYLTRVSVQTLGAEGRFNIFVSRESGVASMAETWRPGGPPGEKEAKEFLDNQHMTGAAAGASDLPAAFGRAVAAKPKTIVLLVGKKVLDDPASLGRQAKEAGAKVIAISLDADEFAADSAAKVAEAGGGAARNFSFSQLQVWLNTATRLD